MPKVKDVRELPSISFDELGAINKLPDTFIKTGIDKNRLHFFEKQRYNSDKYYREFSGENKGGKFPGGFFLLNNVISFRQFLFSTINQHLFVGPQIGLNPKHFKAFDKHKIPDFENIKPTQHAAQYYTPILIDGRGVHVFGHWHLDFLPMIHAAIEFGERIDQPTKLLLRERTDKFQWKNSFCKLLDYKEEWFESLPLQPIFFRQLLVPTFPKRGFKVNLTLLRKTYHKVNEISKLNSTNCSLNDRYKKIYISRKKWTAKDTKRPVLTNEDAVIRFLQSEGFVLAYPETLSINEQVALFQNADIIIGEDGSALHNIAFCKPRTRCIVIKNPTRINFWHYAIASASKVNLIMFDNCNYDEKNNKYQLNIEELRQYIKH